jgi:hypothetical protein
MRNGGFRSDSRPPRGRKRVIRNFTVRHGFWLLGVVTAIMLFIYLLWGLGIIRFDAD